MSLRWSRASRPGNLSVLCQKVKKKIETMLFATQIKALADVKQVFELNVLFFCRLL
jgi:hypothetical protein